MKKKKTFMVIGILSVMTFTIITILFSTLFKIKNEDLQSQVTVELGALELRGPDDEHDEYFGTKCEGGNVVYGKENGVESNHVPKGYFCVEDGASAVTTNQFDAEDFESVLNRYTLHGANKEVSIKLKDWDNSYLAHRAVPGYPGYHISAYEYYKSLGNYELVRKENGFKVRSNTFWKCTNDHWPLSDKMAYTVTSRILNTE